jgi:predicted ATPase
MDPAEAPAAIEFGRFSVLPLRRRELLADWARRQGALSWELRAATSLARLQSDQGRFADAIALLRPVYDQFTGGFDTADLRAARALLNALSVRCVRQA